MGGETAARAVDVSPAFEVAALLEGTVRVGVVDQFVAAGPGVTLEGLEGGNGVEDAHAGALELDDLIEEQGAAVKVQEEVVLAVIRVIELEGDAAKDAVEEGQEAGDFSGVDSVGGDVGEESGVIAGTDVSDDTVEDGGAAELVVGGLEAIDADPDDAGRQVEGQGTVGGEADTEEALLRIDNEVGKAVGTILPEERLAALEDEDAAAALVKAVDDGTGLFPGRVTGVHGVERTLPAGQVAAVGELVTGQKGLAAGEEVVSADVGGLGEDGWHK